MDRQLPAPLNSAEPVPQLAEVGHSVLNSRFTICFVLCIFIFGHFQPEAVVSLFLLFFFTEE